MAKPLTDADIEEFANWVEGADTHRLSIYRSAALELLATIRALKAALERITALHSESYPPYPVAQGGGSSRLDYGLGIDQARYEVANIARAALRGEEAL